MNEPEPAGTVLAPTSPDDPANAGMKYTDVQPPVEDQEESFVRVTDKETGHKYSVARDAVDPARHRVLTAPATSPDGRMLPPELAEPAPTPKRPAATRKSAAAGTTKARRAKATKKAAPAPPAPTTPATTPSTGSPAAGPAENEE